MKPKQIRGDADSELRRRDFLKYAAGGVAAGALGANAVMDAQAQAILKADRSLLNTWPTLTSATKDWRWGRIRSMMADNNVDAMLIMNGQASRYLSEIPNTTLLFPIDDEPIAFSVYGSGAMDAEAIMKGEDAGIETWVRDYRSAHGTPPQLAAAIEEKNLQNARIGTFGVQSAGHMQRRTGNWRPGGLANALQQQHPGLEFVELWDEFMQLWLVKNDEETAMFRKAAAAAELACELFRDACVPGNTLADVKAAAYTEPSRYGVEMVHLWTGGGPDGGREIPWLQARNAPAGDPARRSDRGRVHGELRVAELTDMHFRVRRTDVGQEARAGGDLPRVLRRLPRRHTSRDGVQRAWRSDGGTAAPRRRLADEPADSHAESDRKRDYNYRGDHGAARLSGCARTVFRRGTAGNSAWIGATWFSKRAWPFRSSPMQRSSVHS